MATLFFKQFEKDIEWWLDLPEKSIDKNVSEEWNCSLMHTFCHSLPAWRWCGRGVEGCFAGGESYKITSMRSKFDSSQKGFQKISPPPKFPKLATNDFRRSVVVSKGEGHLNATGAGSEHIGTSGRLWICSGSGRGISGQLAQTAQPRAKQHWD